MRFGVGAVSSTSGLRRRALGGGQPDGCGGVPVVETGSEGATGRAGEDGGWGGLVAGASRYRISMAAGGRAGSGGLETR